MSSYLCEWLRSYPLKRLIMWISSVYGPRMPVCTPYNICVAPDEMTAGLLRCKHKPHLCMLGPNATLIKSDRAETCTLVTCCCAAPPVVLLLLFCSSQFPYLLVSPLHFWHCGGGHNKPSGCVLMDGPSCRWCTCWVTCARILLYATNKESTRKDEDRETVRDHFLKNFLK